LVEYEVDAVYKGILKKGKITVEHLACNNNELDELKVGEKVLVVAVLLPKLESSSWKQSQPGEGKHNEPVTVRYRGEKVAKLIYPTAPAR
jgi:hypothetical protein